MKFRTKDSGKRIEFPTGMKRDVSGGKIRYDLTIPLSMKEHMLKRWGMLMERGAVKYGERNWEKAATADELARYRESAIRHFFQWYDGEEDEDHAAAVFFNIQGAEYVRGKLNNDKN